MADIPDFCQQLFCALEKKTLWYNTEQLPHLLETYRLLHSCVKSIYDLLVKQSCIPDDPYKYDNKISEIKVFEDTPVSDNDRAVVIGGRFSDYENMLEYICHYYNFTTEYINTARIQSLTALNDCISWEHFTTENPSPTISELARMVLSIRQTADAITINSINDATSKCVGTSKEIEAMLKELADFQKELFKGEIRKAVMNNPDFDFQKAAKSAPDEIEQIRKIYDRCMQGKPFPSELVDEITMEDLASNKEELQAALLESLAISEDQGAKKVFADPKSVLKDAIFQFATVAKPLDRIRLKIIENHDMLQSDGDTLWKKIIRMVRKAFKVSEPPVVYLVSVTDDVTGTVHSEKIQYDTFIAGLEKRIRYYEALLDTQSAIYKKLENSTLKVINEFLIKQMQSFQNVQDKINALDAFFRNTIGIRAKRVRIQLLAIKNSVLKANNSLAEYASYVEERKAMNDLGIKDGDI